jgi:hypothetical protein
LSDFQFLLGSFHGRPTPSFLTISFATPLYVSLVEIATYSLLTASAQTTAKSGETQNTKKPADIPAFAKGSMAYHATYSKPGSSERRTIYVYAAKDGSNSFLLEASTGQRVIENNEEISKRFSVLQIEYEAGGFERTNSGTGGSLHRLFIR